MNLFRRRAASRPAVDDGLGLFLFDDVSSALAAEAVLKSTGYDAVLVAPPHHLRAGCDLAVALPRVERPGAEIRLRDSGAEFKDWADTLDGTSTLADIVTTVDFGPWLMVRAGNMKMTVEKATGLIVNTSGGGCPDIPYLNLQLVGRTIWDAPSPRELGYTLCGLMLDRAHRECCRILEAQREDVS